MTGIKTTQPARVAGKNGFSLISDEKFRELYGALLQCRMLDDRLPTSPAYERWTGREAGTAGVIACLRPGDSVTLTPRSVVASYLQSTSLKREAAPTVTAHLAAGTSEALRHKLENLENIAVVFASADEAERASDVFSTAAGSSLPVLYVLEGSAPLREVRGSPPVIRVDGSDAVAVYRVAHESIARARQGGGPTIIECTAWPSDAAPQEPLAKLEHYLADKKLFRQAWKHRLEKKYSKALGEAITAAGLSGF